MHPLVLASMSASGTRRLTQVGLLIAVLGAAVIAVASFFRMQASSRSATHGAGKWGGWGVILIGALALAFGLGLVLIALHFGVSPYRPRPPVAPA